MTLSTDFTIVDIGIEMKVFFYSFISKELFFSSRFVASGNSVNKYIIISWKKEQELMQVYR